MTATRVNAAEPYQVVLCVGGHPADGLPATTRLVDLPVDLNLLTGPAPAAPAADPAVAGERPQRSVDPRLSAVVDALAASGLQPFSLRSKAAVYLDCAPDLALVVVAAIWGFAGRRVDVIVAGEAPMILTGLDAAARTLPDAGRPDSVPDHLQVGAVHESLRYVLTDHLPTADEVSLIKSARRVRFVAPAQLTAAVQYLTVVAGVRSRSDLERLPFLVRGDEPALEPTQPASTVVGLCLDTAYKLGAELRRTLRPEDGIELVDKVEPGARNVQLIAAAAIPMEDVLVRLGARSNPRTALWHCPRPQRHTHGDREASMQVNHGQVRCFRCDLERVDAIRLVMDTLGLSPDEAAAWLVSGASLPPHQYPGYDAA